MIWNQRIVYCFVVAIIAIATIADYFSIDRSGTRTIPPIAEETLAQAADRDFDFKRNLEAAYQGNEASLDALFRFAKQTDAAGALGYGVAVVELVETIGEELPASVAKRLAPDEKQCLAGALAAGVAYGLERDPDEAPQRYPVLYRALNQNISAGK